MEDSLNQQLDLPPEVSHYRFRIAGHTHVQGKLKLGMLKHNNGNILKPLLNGDARSERELSFYQQVMENYECDPVLYELKSFIPSFYGTWETVIDSTNIKYMCIEDICGKFKNPCVLDIKIGSITYDPFATEEKKMKDIKKYPPVEIFGFRILGMKIYDHITQLYVSLNKTFGLSLKTTDDVNAGLGRFFKNNLGQINYLILSSLYHKLLQLKCWFSKQRKFVFISSSILFVYEGNLSSWLTWMDKNSMHLMNQETCKQNGVNSVTGLPFLHHSDCSAVIPSSIMSSGELNGICSSCHLHQDICNKLQENSSLIQMSMLDFAHVFPTSEEDSNYTFGLNSLMSYWQQLMKDSLET